MTQQEQLHWEQITKLEFFEKRGVEMKNKRRGWALDRRETTSSCDSREGKGCECRFPRTQSVCQKKSRESPSKNFCSSLSWNFGEKKRRGENVCFVSALCSQLACGSPSRHQHPLNLLNLGSNFSSDTTGFEPLMILCRITGDPATWNWGQGSECGIGVGSLGDHWELDLRVWPLYFQV